MLSDEVVRAVYRAAELLEQEQGIKIDLPCECAEKIASGCGGDVRKAMNALELSVISADVEGETRKVTLEIVEQLVQKSALRYDKDGDEHYDIVSASSPVRRCADTWFP